MLQVDRLRVARSGLQILDDISFHIRQGERLALVGENGSGKSTLLKTIAGLLRADRGKILWQGSDITNMPTSRRVRRGIAYAFQLPQPFFHLTTDEVWQLVRPVGSTQPAMLEQLWRQLFPAGTLVRDLAYLPMKQLDWLMTLRLGPRLFLMDEPFAGLGAAEVARFVMLIEHLLPQQTTVIFAEHKFESIRRLATRVAVIRQRRIVAVDQVSADWQQKLNRDAKTA